MRLRRDERAVTVQVAAILLLGFVVISLAIYQVAVIPQETKQQELEHSRTIDTEFSEVRSSIIETGQMGGADPTSLSLGVRYRPRLLFVNPPPASGSVTTKSVQERNSTVTLGNAASVDSETGDYWNETTHNLVTNRLVFEPSYNSLSNPPTHAYENTVAYATVGGENVMRSGQILVEGNRIRATVLTGDLSQSGVDTTTLEIRSVSTTTRSVKIENPTDEHLNLTVPSRLDVSTWRNLLNQQNVSGDVYRVQRASPGKIAILFDNSSVTGAPKFYEIELVRVHLGEEPAGQDPTYLTDVGGTAREVVQESTTTLTVEVRDRYDEPVSGVRINASASAGTIVSPTTVRSSENGRASFRYRVAPGQTSPGTVNVSFDDSPHPAKNVIFEITPVTGNGATIDDGTGNSLTWATAVDWDAGDPQAEQAVVHESFGDHTSSEIELGYPSGSNRWASEPLGYWPFDEVEPGSEATVTDVTASNDGVVEGASNSADVSDPHGVVSTSAVQLDSADEEYVALDTRLDPVLGGTGSISVWVKTTQSGDNTMWQAPGITGAESSGDGNDIFWGWLDSDGRIGLTVGNDRDAEVKSENPINDGTWHHIVMTRNAATGEIAMYVNGSSTGSAVAGGGSKTTEFSGIGRIADTAGSPEYFDGSLDEFRYYNKVLDAGEVQSLYAVGQSGTHISAYKQFDTVADPTSLSLSTTETLPDSSEVTVYVQSDPDTDGIFEEESDRIVLGGSGSHTVSGLTSPSARFRLRVVMDTADVIVGPTLRTVVLQK